MERLTDEELADLVRQGNREAYRLLVERHKGMVFTLIRCKVDQRETAEDLAQEVFLKLYRGLANFRGDAKLTTWIYRMVINTVADYHRIKKRRPIEAVIDTVKEWFADRQQESEAQVIEMEERQSMRRLLNELPAKYRDLLFMHYYLHLSSREIAEMIQLPLKTVETRLLRGKHILKVKWLEVNGHDNIPSPSPNAGTVSKL